MNTLLKLGIGAAVGFVAGFYCISNDANNGKVIVDDEEKYIKVAENKTGGWSYAKVHWKNPIEE